MLRLKPWASSLLFSHLHPVCRTSCCLCLCCAWDPSSPTTSPAAPVPRHGPHDVLYALFSFTYLTPVSSTKTCAPGGLSPPPQWGSLSNPHNLINIGALTGVAQWVVHHSAKPEVAGSIPSRSCAWAVGQVPQSGHIQEAINQCFSPPSPSLSLSKWANEWVNKAVGGSRYLIDG